MKTLWSEWDRLLFRNRVLCRKCESDGGDQIIDQVILPESLRQKQDVVGAPMEGIAIDILGPLPEAPQINKLILVVSHYFTKWTEIYTMPNQEATTVAEKRVSEFICRFGEPRHLHSDQGTNLESKV